jgi:hypothetical protein
MHATRSALIVQRATSAILGTKSDPACTLPRADLTSGWRRRGVLALTVILFKGRVASRRRPPSRPLAQMTPLAYRAPLICFSFCSQPSPVAQSHAEPDGQWQAVHQDGASTFSSPPGVGKLSRDARLPVRLPSTRVAGRTGAVPNLADPAGNTCTPSRALSSRPFSSPVLSSALSRPSPTPPREV